MISRAPLEVRQRFLHEFTLELLENSAKIRKQRIKGKLEKVKDIEEEPYDILMNLLKEKEIWAVECPGPDRFLILNRAGELKISKISFDEKEIQEIIEKLAKKSGSEISDTIFKFQTPDYEISGIISEEAGSRFLIEKIIE